MSSAVTKQTVLRYSVPSVALHWLVAVLVVATASIGLYMADLPEAAPGREWYFDLHRSLGVAVFVFLLARALWRARHRPPELVASISRLQRVAARATHIALYALLAAVPLTGYLMTNLEGEGVKFFGLPLPTVATPDSPAGRLFADVHSFAAWTLIVLASVHALAALKHHFIDRDETLARMIPGLRPRTRR